jgi:DNA polymerase I
MTKLLIIDGNAIAHRAYHAIPDLTNKHGAHTNAVYGFVSILANLTNNLKPSHLIVTFDEKEKTFRRKEYEHYQAKRPKMDEWLSLQITMIREWLDEARVSVFSKSGYEADDVIGTIADKSLKSFEETIIVTGDRDIFQLINKKVKVYVPIKGLKEGKLYGDVEFRAEFDFDPPQMIDYKALVGDSSDNYPGVTGIGPKTARDLIIKYKTVEEIYNNLDKIEERVKTKLEKGAKDAIFFKKLATIFKEVPIIINFDESVKWDLGCEQSISYLENLGFKTILKRLPKKEDQGQLF